MTTTDELMRLHDDAAIAQTEWVMTGNGEMREDETRQALRSAIQEVVDRAEIGAQILRACSELPDGALIQVCAEKDAGWVELYCPERERAYFDDVDLPFHERVSAAIDAAIRNTASQSGG